MKVKRVLLFASLCFVFSLFPFGSAFAYDGVVAGPLNGEGGNQVYVVNAHSSYDASEYLLGLDYSSLTADQRAYLSNESTGGAFYQFVHSFQPLQFGNYPEGFMEATYYTGLIAVYGSASLFWIETNAIEKAAAIASYTAIKNGEVGGGGGNSGGGNGVFGGYMVFTGNMSFANGTAQTNQKYKGDNFLYVAGLSSVGVNGAVAMPESFNYKVPLNSTLSTFLQNYPSDDYVYYLKVSSLGGETSLKTAFVICAFPKSEVVVSKRTTNTPNGGTQEYIYYVGTSPSVRVNMVSCDYTLTTFNGTDMVIDTVDDYRTSTTSDISITGIGAGFIFGVSTDGGGTPTVPPTQWPEPEPTPTPEPPELPTPPSNPTVPIEPEPPTYPSPIIVGGTTQSVDIQGILDAMDEHCQHLQSAISSGFSNYYTKITTYLRQLFDWLRQVLQGMMDDWTDYFDDALHWLADQFDFTFTGSDYDDSSILFWLKRIWLKLGNGNSSRPVDPVTDPFGIGEWLNQLLQNLVLDLLALGANGLADIVESFRELITKFPFCIPWDIAAMLALLVSEPVAPSVDVPAYTVTNNGLQQVGTYHIDLEDYDESMEGVRAMETLVFAFWLAFKTDFFKGVLSMGGEKQ